MTTPAKLQPRRWRRMAIGLSLFLLIGGGGVAAGLALLGSAAATPPEMARSAVNMPDGRQVYVQRYEVSVAQWNECHKQGQCPFEIRLRANQVAETTPATGLNYLDAQAYVAWISKAAKHPFRLPTLEEWQFMAQEVMPKKADPIFTDPALSWASGYLIEDLTPRALKASGSFPETTQGVSDLSGSVWEWTMDCYTPELSEAECPAFFVAGEHKSAMSFLVRDPARGGCAVGAPPAHLGMRLVSDKDFQADTWRVCHQTQQPTCRT